MKMGIGGRENVFHAIGQECAIPSGLEKSRVGLMDFLHGMEIANVDTVEADPNDRAFMRHTSAIYTEGVGPFHGCLFQDIGIVKILTIFLMEFMDIEWDFADKPIVYVHKIGPLRDHRTWDPGDRAGKPAIDEMLKLKSALRTNISRAGTKIYDEVETHKT